MAVGAEDELRKVDGDSTAPIDFTQSKSFNPDPIIGFVLYAANKNARSARIETGLDSVNVYDLDENLARHLQDDREGKRRRIRVSVFGQLEKRHLHGEKHRAHPLEEGDIDLRL